MNKPHEPITLKQARSLPWEVTKIQRVHMLRDLDGGFVHSGVMTFTAGERQMCMGYCAVRDEHNELDATMSYTAIKQGIVPSNFEIKGDRGEPQDLCWLLLASHIDGSTRWCDVVTELSLADELAAERGEPELETI